ncbi:MAG: PQQ-binding-like beta-propeller repeat protein [Planctomycetota bacterium]
MTALTLLLSLAPIPELPAASTAPDDAPAETRDAGSGRWANWRGPHRSGASDATGLPTTWSATENVVWKAKMPSWSGATPAIWDDHIFLLSPSALTDEEVAERAKQAEERGGRRRRRSRRDPGGNEMLLLCLGTEDGAEKWRVTLDEGNTLYRKGNNASPSPVTDGTHVWTVTGNGTVSAHDFAGKKVWSTNLQETWGEFGLMWGYASSPVLVEGMLIVQVLHGTKTDEPSYLVAFEAGSGEVLWRTERPTDAPAESPDAYTTPLLVERGDALELVVTGGDYVTGHDLASGDELWRVAGLNPRKARNYRIVPSAVLVGDVLVALTRLRPVLGIRLTGDAAPTEESIAWRWEESGGPDVPTPATDGELVYMVDDSGMVTCIVGANGEALWGPERTVQGTVSASPLLADDKLFVTNEEGITVVLGAGGADFEQLAVNELDGSYTLSSPIAVGDRLYVRTGEFLYCIAEGGAKKD